MVKSAEPQPSTSGYGKKRQDTQEEEGEEEIRQKKAKKRYVKRKTVTTPCLYCSEAYSKSKDGDGWMKCGKCDLWVHNLYRV